MLSTWLGDLGLDGFRAQHLQRVPLAMPGTARSACGLLDWSGLARILLAKPDVLVVARGQLLPFPPPTELVELRAYFRMGIGLAMRHTERVDPVMAEVAQAFERDVGAAQVQIFVTPPETHGFGWHYDDEDVFIAQTHGVKDYYFRANTVTDALASPLEFQKYPGETAPLCTATLVAGDFLYIPARWWHMAICREESLSISVGVYPRSTVQMAGPPQDSHGAELAR